MKLVPGPRVFGANPFCLALPFVVDGVYLLAGLVERRHRLVLRMGPDSIAVLVAYCVGLWLLWQLR